MTRIRTVMITAALLPWGCGTARAQGRPDMPAVLAAQREAMARLAFMDGIWRGPAWTILPSGEKHAITQTERIGPFLGGTVKVLEGRGYDPDGRVTFNAFGTISFQPETRTYNLHSYALGHVGDFALTLTPEGYVWEIPLGAVTIRYTAVIKGGAWLEVGDRLQPGHPPARFFEMNLRRVGDSSWPAADPVPPK